MIHIMQLWLVAIFISNLYEVTVVFDVNTHLISNLLSNAELLAKL